MSEPRSFSVCQGCGAWRETSGNVLQLFADYDMRFFIKQHLVRCPATGQPAALISVHEDDPGYQPLPPEKQWKPEDCPDYRPQQKPTSKRYTTEVSERLIGIWTNDSFGSHSDECLVFFRDGKGIIEYWNFGFAGYERFRWRLDGEEHLIFDEPEADVAEHGRLINGAFEYFRTDRVYFELLSATNSYGEQRDVLCISCGRGETEAMQFLRSPRSIDGYEIPAE